MLCEAYGLSVRNLATWDSFSRAQPLNAMKFVENHDLRDGDQPIVGDKMLAYGYILTLRVTRASSGRTTTTGSPSGGHVPRDAALVGAHEPFAGGGTEIPLG